VSAFAFSAFIPDDRRDVQRVKTAEM